MNKSVAVVQARMGSKRLPGKALRLLGSRPAILHTLENLRTVSCVSQVIVATSEAQEDDALARLCLRQGFTVHRGSLNDVYQRVLDAGEAARADYILRIPGDKPIVDRSNIRKLVLSIEKHPIDFVANFYPRTHQSLKVLPPGLEIEVFSLEALKNGLAYRLADEVDREHVTSVFYRNPTFFRSRFLINFQYIRFRKNRLNLDFPEDLVVLNEVFRELGEQPRPLDALRFIRASGRLNALNKSVVQRPLPLS